MQTKEQLLAAYSTSRRKQAGYAIAIEELRRAWHEEQNKLEGMATAMILNGLVYSINTEAP